MDKFWGTYSKETPTRVKLIDWFIFFLLSIIGVQFFYRVIIGNDFPKNAFITGIFCPLGIIVLLVSIRSSAKDYKLLAQFFIAAITLFIVSINFLG